jgi:hypothetical protein
MDEDNIRMQDWYTTRGDVPRFRVLAVEVKTLLLHIYVYGSIWVIHSCSLSYMS